MARTVELLRVFVASPSDVEEERSALADVILELNRVVCPHYGVLLELVRFETHTYPGFGVDAQEVINQQICDDYDIFIGVIWTRFGTPTLRAGSGTEEEFNRAFARFREGPCDVQVMMYFKDKPVEPSQIDLQQFSQVAKFKETVQRLGGYSSSFKDLDEFARGVRLHLSLYIKGRSQGKSTGSKITIGGETISHRVR